MLTETFSLIILNIDGILRAVLIPLTAVGVGIHIYTSVRKHFSGK